MTVAGTIGIIGKWNETSPTAGFLVAGLHSEPVILTFRDKASLDRLFVMKAGDAVVVRGLIETITRYLVELGECQIQETRPVGL
jgi:hypothetical protein